MSFVARFAGRAENQSAVEKNEANVKREPFLYVIKVSASDDFE